MSDPSFDQKLRSAFRDLDLLQSGWRPNRSIEAVPLDGWYPISHRALDLPALAGWADHPRLGQQLITTSPVLWIDDGRTIARCLSRWYRLGQPGRPIYPSWPDFHVPVTTVDDLRRLESRIANTGRIW